jgi:uncharacterized protein YjbI with pentapeptide repeats
VDQEQKPRERSFIRELVPDWRPSRGQVLWTVRIVLVLVVVLGLLTLIGLPFDVTLWNWMDLLIIPVVLAIGGYLFTRAENRATRVAAEQRAQDEALQAYLDQMGELLLDKDRPLRQSEEGDEVRMLARARTLTALKRLDSQHNRSVFEFLRDADLLGRGEHSIINFRFGDLSGVNLRDATLSDADFTHAKLEGANLRDANLMYADFTGARLNDADLSGALLLAANLRNADLSNADLTDANQGVPSEYIEPRARRGRKVTIDLQGAYLHRAVLRRADLTYANLRDADLSGADLRDEIVTDEQLATCESLEGATMPNGQKYEEWLKSKGCGEDGENSGPS